MKKILLIALITIFLLSCQQSDFEFSCDPEINEFVINNREELAKITTKEFASYDLRLQKAIYNSWDYQKKKEAWIDKLQYTLNSISFSEDEVAHIQKLIRHIELNYFFKKNIEKNREARSQFANEWINYSINKLGWSDQFIAFLVYRLYTNQEQFDAELSVLKTIRAAVHVNSESGSCDCNSSADFCGNGITCNSGGCATTGGCGWLWTKSCNGSCY
jgi:hypothetical protein